MAPSLHPDLYASASSESDLGWMERMREEDASPLATRTSLPRFTLVVGPSPFTMPRGWEYYLTCPAEGPTAIATVLHNAGYPVRIVDVRFDPDPLQSAWRQVSEGTDVLGITTFEDNFPFCRELMELTRDGLPGVTMVCGGSLVTSVPHVFFEHTACDVAVISEGELTILELMDAIADGRLDRALPGIRGIWWRGPEGEVHRNPARGQMPDLDCVPLPRLDLWPQASAPGGLQPQVITSFSRGCKMDCSFCFRTTPQVRAKSPARFEQEVRWLKERYGITFLFFSDLTFSADTAQTLAICDTLRPQKMRWTCMTRCADADDTRLRAMASAGCDIILFGVESLTAEALKEAHKPTTEHISMGAMHRSMAAGIRFGTLLIVGLPGETAESLEYMARWAEEWNNLVRVKYLSAMPGTRVYHEGLARGLMRSERDHIDWLSIEQALPEDEFINYNGLPEATVRRAYRRLYDAYQPGPVMEFHHWPRHFEFFHPNPDDGGRANVDYAGPGWRARFSSAGPSLPPGSERFTLDRVGAPGAAEGGASLAVCGAKRLIAEGS
jgi:anaerobic magnesium-protoporphyrin IX monomethyl ester cyclase